MYSFRVNLDTNQVEVLVDGHVEFEVPKEAFPQFAFLAWKEAKNPTQMRRVRNAIDYSFKSA